MTAAQVAWELHVGPVPDGRRVWRRCRQAACVRPDHLLLVRRGYPPLVADAEADSPTEPSTHIAPRGLARRGQGDGRRAWWTRERVVAGLAAFHIATGLAPTTTRHWAGLVRGLRAPRQHPRHYPSEYAVLRHFPSFRAAWLATGIQLDDEHWARWTPDDDRYLVTHLGVQPTASIAATLRRGEAAVRTRARKLGLCVGLAHGWPLLRIACTAGISEYALRGYVDRGELPVFKGAKHVYLDPADLPTVKEIDWQQLPAELEAAVLQSLRWRLIQILAGRDWRTMRLHRLHPRKNRRTRPHSKPRVRVPLSGPTHPSASIVA